MHGLIFLFSTAYIPHRSQCHIVSILGIWFMMSLRVSINDWTWAFHARYSQSFNYVSLYSWSVLIKWNLFSFCAKTLYRVFSILKLSATQILRSFSVFSAYSFINYGVRVAADSSVRSIKYIDPISGIQTFWPRRDPKR